MFINYSQLLTCKYTTKFLDDKFSATFVLSVFPNILFPQELMCKKRGLNTLPVYIDELFFVSVDFLM